MDVGKGSFHAPGNPPLSELESLGRSMPQNISNLQAVAQRPEDHDTLAHTQQGLQLRASVQIVHKTGRRKPAHICESASASANVSAAAASVGPGFIC